MTDRLTLARALEEGGASRDAAEHIATEIYAAIADNVATKTDVEHAVATLRGEMREMELRLDTKIDRVVARTVAAIVIALGVLFGALHYWPPH
jgi:Fe2+ transport system protein B